MRTKVAPWTTGCLTQIGCLGDAERIVARQNASVIRVPRLAAEPTVNHRRRQAGHAARRTPRPKHVEKNAETITRVRNVRSDWLVAASGLAASLLGLGLDEASAVTAAVYGGLASVGAALGVVVVLRLRRRLASERREREKREVEELRTAVDAPEEKQLAAFEKVVREEGRHAARVARVYFWLGVLITVAVAVLVDVFAHFLPTIR